MEAPLQHVESEQSGAPLVTQVLGRTDQAEEDTYDYGPGQDGVNNDNAIDVNNGDISNDKHHGDMGYPTE